MCIRIYKQYTYCGCQLFAALRECHHGHTSADCASHIHHKVGIVKRPGRACPYHERIFDLQEGGSSPDRDRHSGRKKKRNDSSDEEDHEEDPPDANSYYWDRIMRGFERGDIGEMVGFFTTQTSDEYLSSVGSPSTEEDDDDDDRSDVNVDSKDESASESSSDEYDGEMEETEMRRDGGDMDEKEDYWGDVECSIHSEYRDDARA